MMRWPLAFALLWPMSVGASGYTLQVGDLLRIEVIENSSLDRNALVLPDGIIAFLLVGQVEAAGLSLDQIRANLGRELAPNFVVTDLRFSTRAAAQATREISQLGALDLRIDVVKGAGSSNLTARSMALVRRFAGGL